MRHRQGRDRLHVIFDIRWKSTLAGRVLPERQRPADAAAVLAARGCAANTQQEREVSEDFIFWLSPPAGTERVAEVKIEVLRVGSDDRRRERRTRHVWDVL